MIDLLAGLVNELRAAGLPVSLTEHVDAARALTHVPLDDRSALKHSLGSALVKTHDHWPIFDTVFEIYFSPLGIGHRDDAADDAGSVSGDLRALAAGDETQPAAADLPALLRLALAGGDDALARLVAREAVRRYAGITAGRPVGGAYYLYRTLQGLDLEGMLGRMLAERAPGVGGDDEPTVLERRLAADDLTTRADSLRREIEAEVRRRLVSDRGAAAVARAARRPAPADVDVLHATRDELAAMARAVQPLARRLAVRVDRRRRHRRHGALHFRDTVRRSLSSGGVPADPRFRHRRPSRPELFVLADVSGSVAAFARFTLQLIHALSGQFSRVRSFVFVDDIDEVTACFEGDPDLGEAVARADASVAAAGDGHSDYGRVLRTFQERWGEEITRRSTVIVLGDARGNYHSSGAEVLGDVRARARHLYWLNPEPATHWDTGDSVMSEYARHCDAVFECRSLRHLERFVEHLG